MVLPLNAPSRSASARSVAGAAPPRLVIVITRSVIGPGPAQNCRSEAGLRPPPPPGVPPPISATAASSRPRSRLPRVARDPRSASSLAVSSPMPLLAPITATCRPFMLILRPPLRPGARGPATAISERAVRYEYMRTDRSVTWAGGARTRGDARNSPAARPAAQRAGTPGNPGGGHGAGRRRRAREPAHGGDRPAGRREQGDALPLVALQGGGHPRRHGRVRGAGGPAPGHRN